ncbi:MAG: replication initiation protein [bacterium]|nr:replication initiation protein [bacterium]
MILPILLLFFVAGCSHTESTCYGTPRIGYLKHGKRLPFWGSNFTSYGFHGIRLGRTYVHSRVYRVIVAAYESLAKTHPGKKFMYGEAGLESGGRIESHKTHRNGLSVDFFVPVLDKNNVSCYLPTEVDNNLGYDFEFNKKGKFREFRIDFTAMAAHIAALYRETKKSSYVRHDEHYHIDFAVPCKPLGEYALRSIKEL